MSKKPKKPAAPKIRRRWAFSPVERVKPSSKLYSRKRLRPPEPEA